jgi:hypothetical protein
LAAENAACYTLSVLRGADHGESDRAATADRAPIAEPHRRIKLRGAFGLDVQVIGLHAPSNRPPRFASAINTHRNQRRLWRRSRANPS